MSLEERLRYVEDVIAISKLKIAYCNAADGGWDRPSHNPKAVADLFTDDGIWDVPTVGTAVGKTEIYKLFSTFDVLYFGFHFVSSPSIEVRGDEAAGQWHLIGLLIHRDKGQLMAGGVYHDSFRRTPEGWRFSKIQLSLAFMNPPEKGWQDLVFQANFTPKL